MLNVRGPTRKGKKTKKSLKMLQKITKNESSLAQQSGSVQKKKRVYIFVSSISSPDLGRCESNTLSIRQQGFTKQGLNQRKLKDPIVIYTQQNTHTMSRTKEKVKRDAEIQ